MSVIVRPLESAEEYHWAEELQRRVWGFVDVEVIPLHVLLTAHKNGGLVLGAFVQGLEVEGNRYVGGALDWLTPFSMFTALAVPAGYALLGATWLILKTEGELQAWSRRQARWLGWMLLGAIVVASVWTPMLERSIAERWFSWPNLLLLSPVPLLTWLAMYGLMRSLA